MNILWLLIPLALGLGGAFLWGFIWAARSRQFDELDEHRDKFLEEN